MVIEIDDKNVHILNVSSIKGKEQKLGYKSNKKIDKYKPPFWKPSFVKLDALYMVEKNEVLKNFLLLEGRSMHPVQLNKIKQDFIEYRERTDIFVKKTNIADVLNINMPSLAESAMDKRDE